jgi:PAS domain S-box-containing protein
MPNRGVVWVDGPLAVDELRSLVDDADEPVVEVGASGRIREVNPAFEEQLGWRPATVESAHVEVIVDTQDVDRLRRFLQEVVQDPRPDRAVLATTDGHREPTVCIWSAVPSPRDGRPAAWIVVEPLPEGPEGPASSDASRAATILPRWPPGAGRDPDAEPASRRSDRPDRRRARPRRDPAGDPGPSG